MNTPTASTATQAIKENPYCKVRNCTDVADCQYAIDYLFACERKYGEQRQITNKLAALINKRNRFQEKEATHA